VHVRFRSPPSFARPALLTALLSVSASLAPGAAWAGEKEDNAVVASVERVFAKDVANANFGEARKKLRNLLDRCKRGCSGTAVARVYVALGVVAAQINQTDEARSSWNDAFSLDPNAALPANGVPPNVRQQFEDARKAWNPGAPPSEEAPKNGWINKHAYDLATAGIAAEQAQDWSGCIEKDRSALTLEENTRTRIHLAQCEEKAGKLVDALRDYAKALEGARARGDVATAKTIQERVTVVSPKLAHVRFERPPSVTELQIRFDDQNIPEARLGESFTIDPGTHEVHAEGVLRGARVSSDERFEVKSRDDTLVKLKLKPGALTKGQLECMASAKTQGEILACLPQESRPLQVHLGLETSGYADTIAVRVLTPAVRASIVSPTAGWNVGASYLVDVVSAASPDVVSTASRRFKDVRHAVGLTGGYKPGRFGAQAFANYSQERDYISRTVGVTAVGDFYDKLVTPALGYSYTWDTIGRAGTSYDVFGKPFDTHEITAGSTFVLTPTSLLVLGGSVALENGDQSKPYRYVPLFEPGVSVPAGGSAEEVNRKRLPIKPLEQLPLDRQRFSLSARFVKRIGGRSTLRIEERLYRDTWEIMATSTDARWLVDVGPKLRVWPHLRLHGQTGTSFYNRIYGATLEGDGSAIVPRYRTSDRELSPMIGITGGGGVRYALTSPGRSFQLAVFANADALFNYYANTLYIRTRLAGYGTLGIEADFE
jgi:Protein of unknown function (DUF3570)